MLPYQLGLWLAQYVNPYCHICNLAPSQPIASDKYARNGVSFTKYQLVLKALDKGVLCQGCQDDIAWLPALFEVRLNQESLLPVQSAASYDSIIRNAIIAFKYKANFSALPLLVHAIRQMPVPNGCNFQNSIIIPVPTTNKRLLKRGFDPVSILSRYLSHYWGIPIFDGMARIDNVTSQQGLSRQERFDNIKDAFKLNKPLDYANILLFDDVTTTGATLKSLAECANNTSYPSTISAYTISHGNI